MYVSRNEQIGDEKTDEKFKIRNSSTNGRLNTSWLYIYTGLHCNTNFTRHVDFHNFLILNHVPKPDRVILSPSDWPMYGCREASSDWKTKTRNDWKLLMLWRGVDKCFMFVSIYLFCALVGGVTQLFSSKLFGPTETGVLGLVAPFPDKQAVFNGEQDLRFVFRHDRLRNKSLIGMTKQRPGCRAKKSKRKTWANVSRSESKVSITNLDFSGFSSFNRIWDNSPTKSSSTLWLMPTDVSINLQSYAVAIAFPSKQFHTQNRRTRKFGINFSVLFIRRFSSPPWSNRRNDSVIVIVILTFGRDTSASSQISFISD